MISQDSYGRGPVRREISSLRGRVRSGNSGGPLVDGAGRVMGTVFAATTSGPSGRLRGPERGRPRRRSPRRGEPVDTGPCTG